jgi:hypothetical protein
MRTFRIIFTRKILECWEDLALALAVGWEGVSCSNSTIYLDQAGTWVGEVEEVTAWGKGEAEATALVGGVDASVEFSRRLASAHGSTADVLLKWPRVPPHASSTTHRQLGAGQDRRLARFPCARLEQV